MNLCPSSRWHINRVQTHAHKKELTLENVFFSLVFFITVSSVFSTRLNKMMVDLRERTYS